MTTADTLAFTCRIQHGNHNNAMLIDRVIEGLSYSLMARVQIPLLQDVRTMQASLTGG